METTTLYPISHLPSFAKNEAESDPIYSAACVRAGVDSTDEEVCVVEIDHDEAEDAIRCAGKDLPSFDEQEGDVYSDTFYAVSGIFDGYCKIVHFSANEMQFFRAEGKVMKKKYNGETIKTSHLAVFGDRIVARGRSVATLRRNKKVGSAHTILAWSGSRWESVG